MTTASERKAIERIAQIASNSKQIALFHVGRGATSSAWRAIGIHSDLIVRIMLSRVNRPITYHSEFAILHALRAYGCLVPKPLLHYLDNIATLADIVEPWAVTIRLKGKEIVDNDWNDSIVQELGTMLSILHSLPVSHYGRLEETAPYIVGLQHSELEGVVARWCWAPIWPFDETSLERHVLHTLQPKLSKRVSSLKSDILAVLDTRPCVMVHSDLHAAHIFHHEGEFTGVIDFGAACIAHPAWEFAVLGYYHGWSITDAILEAYSTNDDLRKSLSHQARMLAIAVTMYKLAKADKLGTIQTQAKMAHMISTLEELCWQAN